MKVSRIHMPIPITRPGKSTLYVENRVMPAAGIVGFGDGYRGLIDFSRLGAFVTNPVTYEPWSPAGGTRVVPLDAGVLMHTGLPNPGLTRVLREYSAAWDQIDAPVIVHLVATTPEQVRRSAARLDAQETVQAVELGLEDDITWREAADLVRAAVRELDRPLLVRLPVYNAYEIAGACADAGAGALVVAAPPRGTARDPHTGRLVSGRIYGPLVKPMVLRLVAVLHEHLPDIPLIGAGGIHSPQDARDYLEVGAVAVQVDSVIWVQPPMLGRIARDLGGALVTRAMDAYPDEWHPDMGDTEFEDLMRRLDDESDGQS